MRKVSIILLGESGVGKTALLVRYKTGEFEEHLRRTFMDPHTKKVNIEGQDINLHMQDTSGQKRYNSLIKNYYRKVDGVLLVYDVTDPSSIYNLAEWLKEVKENNKTVQILLAGNKNEDPKKIDVTTVSTAKQFAKDENLEYMEMSAKSGVNVEEAFEYLIEQVLGDSDEDFTLSHTLGAVDRMLIAKGVLAGIESSREQSESRGNIILHETEIREEKNGFCSC